MRNLAALIALYVEIDEAFRSERMAAAAGRASEAVERIERKQQLNDQAYFVICWGQMEAEIDEACRGAIRARLSQPEWTDRRCWDLFNPEDKRLSGLSFEDRAAIVLDRDGGPGSPWALVQRHYSIRNQIAHGKLRPDRIDVVAVSRDFYAIQGALTR